MTQVEFSSLVRVGNNSPRAPQALFSLTSFYFPTNATIPYGTSELFVPENSLKFTVAIEDWPFLSTENSLAFGVDVRFTSVEDDSITTREQNETMDDRGGRDAVQMIQFGELQVTSPLIAIVDGEEQNINTDVEQNGNDVELMWRFPYFSSSLVYDPVISEIQRMIHTIALISRTIISPAHLLLPCTALGGGGDGSTTIIQVPSSPSNEDGDESGGGGPTVRYRHTS